MDLPVDLLDLQDVENSSHPEHDVEGSSHTEQNVAELLSKSSMNAKLTFDDILENYVGEFGPYQKVIYVLACIPAIFAAIMTLFPVFILEVPNHRYVQDVPIP